MLAAIRHRDATGEGQVIDISLLESLVDMVGPGPSIQHRTGAVDGRYGSRLVLLGARATSTSAATGTSCCPGRRTRSRCACSTRSAAATCATTSASRPEPPGSRNVDELDAIISGWTERHTVAEAIDTISAAGAAVGPVYDVAQLVADPHVQERGCFVEVESPAGNEPLLQLAPNPRLSRTPGAIRHAGLPPGACTEEVLAELGYTLCRDRGAAAAGAVGGTPAPAYAVGLTARGEPLADLARDCRPAPARRRRWCGS